MPHFVYVLTNKNNTVLYIGSTHDLYKRILEHKEKVVPGFSERYSLNKLIYFEIFEDQQSAFIRERQMKKWKREWKENLIRKKNNSFRDLFDELPDYLSKML